MLETVIWVIIGLFLLATLLGIAGIFLVLVIFSAAHTDRELLEFELNLDTEERETTKK